MVLEIKNRVPSRLNVNGKTIPCYNELKLMGITFDNELNSKSISRIFIRKHLINYMPSGEQEDTSQLKSI